MTMIRCPACGRISDGQMCLACGHEFVAPNPGAPALTKVGPNELTSASSNGITDTGVVASAENLQVLSDLSGDGPSVDLLDFDSDDEMDIESAPNQVSEVWGDDFESATAVTNAMAAGPKSETIELARVGMYDDEEEVFSDAETVTDFVLGDDHNAVTETADTQIEPEKRNISVVGPSRAIKLSARLGALAESMEAAGRLGEAATLYEAEKLLQSLGH